jgi:nitric oxide reductase NorE protein
MVSTEETTTKTRRLPGVEGVWVFVAADMVVFCVLFVSFMQARSADPALFEVSRQALNANFGGVNTLILLTSSWFVVLAVHSAQEDRISEVPRFLAGGFFCGVAFVISKAIEYTVELTSGHTAGANDFFMYYFSLTGLHLAHVTAGTVILGVLWNKSRQGAYHGMNTRGLEAGATYWHMVDFLWVMIFPLLYLVR